MKLNSRELQIFSIVIAIWGIFLVTSGTIMSQDKKTIVKKTYSIDVSTQQISQIQAKKNEIIVKDITIEAGNPISSNVRDYLENPDQISDTMLAQLSKGLDTSSVNINQAGTYTYSITYKKKTYQAKITVTNKVLPKVTITLREKNMPTTGTISRNVRDYIYENVSDEVVKNMILDLKEVIAHQNIPGKYKYSIIYNDTTYYGDFIIREPVEVSTTTIVCPTGSTQDPNNNTCICQTGTYNPETKECK
ncbi:MAG: hypothetical protein IKQ06_01715 [Bacilli bacterium]|nr:hypothetical protein [Bacilli bacterium]